MKVYFQGAVILLLTVIIISCSTTEITTESDRNPDRSDSPYLPVSDEIADEFLLEELNDSIVQKVIRRYGYCNYKDVQLININNGTKLTVPR